MFYRILVMAFFAGVTINSAMAAPVVLELFTSQSCSSCPPADALLKQLSAQDPGVLALSYHVDYWNHLQWKDTYSSQDSTQRQRNYAQTIPGGVFTPELVVNGVAGMVGSNASDVAEAIAKAKQDAPSLNVAITPIDNHLRIAITAGAHAPAAADIWQVQFDRYAKTQVKAGENGGRMLESINNVTSFTRIGVWTAQTGSEPLMIDAPQEGNVAILLQLPGQGRIVGAASFGKGT